MTTEYRRFRFEGSDGSLNLLPLCARRALDALGLKLPLQAWQSMPLDDRAHLAAAGSAHPVDTESAARLLSKIESTLARLQIAPEPAHDRIPDDVVAALGSEHRLSDAVWASLEPLERYALAKVAMSGNSERLAQAVAEIVGHTQDSVHLSADGGLRMVNVSQKAMTHRQATAETRVAMSEVAFANLLRGNTPKGDVIGTARLAGIMAAKRTDELIPLCHQVNLDSVAIECTPDELTHSVTVTACARAQDRTGVEMEALVAASVAALTIYDMLKAIDRSMTIGPTRLVSKSGGRSGDYRA